MKKFAPQEALTKNFEGMDIMVDHGCYPTTMVPHRVVQDESVDIRWTETPIAIVEIEELVSTPEGGVLMKTGLFRPVEDPEAREITAPVIVLVFLFLLFFFCFVKYKSPFCDNA